jgi:uncharacterized protein YndB with AHSA1/START domain
MRNTEASAEQRALLLEIERTFDAPRELVWRLWRDPEHMVRWHGPEGCALIECDSDFRVGGKWRRCMSSGPGHRHVISGEYVELEEPRRLSFTYVNAYDGFETMVTMDFLDEGGKTRMLFRQTPFISVEERDGHGRGWNSSFDILSNYLAIFTGDDMSPKGPPRRDGVAEDIVAARRRHTEEQRRHADTAQAGRSAGAELPGHPSGREHPV